MWDAERDSKAETARAKNVIHRIEPISIVPNSNGHAGKVPQTIAVEAVRTLKFSIKEAAMPTKCCSMRHFLEPI